MACISPIRNLHPGAAALLLLLLTVSIIGCASANRTPVGPGESSASAPPPEEQRDDEAVATETPPTEGTDEPADSPIADPLVLAGEPVDFEGPSPDEELTESPLDELAEIMPESVVTEIEPQPMLVEPPEFNFPMVTNDKVRFWIDYYTRRNKKSFEAGLERSGRYLPMFREIFREAGLPTDLIYMAHVESGYKTTAYSRARAKGIWQFIAGTGKRYGLRIDYWVDERSDPEKSARAAAAYLTKLYDDFGDWYLAVAAYNAGEGKIGRAIKRTGKKDFWKIARTRHVRRETKNYIPAILAAIQISKDPERFGFEIEREAPLVYDTVEVEGAADLHVLARCAGSDFETLKSLNPALRRRQTPPGATTSVRVPVGAAEKTLIALEQIPKNERVLYARHRVRRGDTLSKIARDYGVTVRSIQQANNMGRRTMIREGRVIVIPTVTARDYPSASVARANVPAGEPVIYRVRRGDTLSRIARRYGTNAASIAAANGFGTSEVLQIGQRLTVVPGVRSSAEARRIARGETPPSSKGGGVVHVVRRGENLSRIARRYGTTPARIAADNGMRVNQTLQIGQRLTVGSRAAAAPTAGASVSTTAEKPDAPEPRTVVHVVRRGDNLSRIARRYGTTAESIAAANGISMKAVLHSGDRLTVVPGVRSTAEARRIANDSKASVTPVTSVTHIVRRGETLWHIASSYATTIDAICRTNGISRRATLYPGTKLNIDVP